MEASHVLKVSLSETVYEAARRLAAEAGVSLEQLAREVITAKTRQLTEVDLTEAYEFLADDAEEADVEVFMEAQSEALLDE